MAETQEKRIEVTVVDCREKFTKWIAERGGVQIWNNVNLSNPDAGLTFTPLRDESGKEYGSPHWSRVKGELITDISRFRFAKSRREVTRFHVALRRGTQGLVIKLTDGSSRKVRRACDKIQKQYGVAPTYHFDYFSQEAVIEVPVFED